MHAVLWHLFAETRLVLLTLLYLLFLVRLSASTALAWCSDRCIFSILFCKEEKWLGGCLQRKRTPNICTLKKDDSCLLLFSVSLRWVLSNAVGVIQGLPSLPGEVPCLAGLLLVIQVMPVIGVLWETLWSLYKSSTLSLLSYMQYDLFPSSSILIRGWFSEKGGDTPCKVIMIIETAAGSVLCACVCFKCMQGILLEL